MSYLDEYCKTIPHEEIKNSLEYVLSDVFDNHLKSFDYQSTVNGLLLGEVQSGKTGQMLGIISAAVDRGFDLFLILTSDNNRLQKQTFARTLDQLQNFCVCDENDELRYKINKMRQPLIIVLKKNYRILSKWRNNLSSEGFLGGRTLFIIDDEADAASLNTKVNLDDQSKINLNIEDMKQLSSSCIYLQVTATPQAVLLQTIQSGFRPNFITYFEPGNAYLGGDFFFSRPKSYTIKHTDLDELDSLKDEDEIITTGLANGILTFLMTTAELKSKNNTNVSNCIVHPSIKIQDHEVIEFKIRSFLNEICHNFSDTEFKNNLEQIWEDLYRTKPDISNFDTLVNEIYDLLYNQEINVIVLNSKTPPNVEYSKGFNIIVGALTLGRGVTFPMLQTVYYARYSKKPQMDTYWQHCRMFGYDRDRELIRLFMPEHQHKIFQDLNNSQKAFVEQIKEGNLDSRHILCLNNLSPTRKSVIDMNMMRYISGGVNYFASFPKNNNKIYIDSLLSDFIDGDSTECDLDLIIELIEQITSEDRDDFNNQDFINALNLVRTSELSDRCRIIVRTDRRLTRGTGTMLSANDRRLVKNYENETVLVMYRLTGEEELGWDGNPFWMPNIKLPEGFTFYSTE